MNIIDIIILAILALSMVSGMYKGFITSTLALVGFVGAWIGAMAAYPFLVSAINANDSLMTFFRSVFGAADFGLTSVQLSTPIANAGAEVINAAAEKLPLIERVFRSNVTGAVFANEGLSTIGDYLTQTLLNTALDIICFVIMFVVIYIAVLLIVNLLNNVFRFPILRHFDWLLGGAFGLVRGLVIVLLIFAVVPTISTAMDSMNVTFLSDLLNESKIGAIFKDSNFVANTLPMFK